MATQNAAARRAASEQGWEYAINKTRGLAFSRQNEAGEWQAIDLKSVSAFQTMERVSHTKIGDNWFSIYRPNNGR